jgi:putative sigma-54 modulation protein
MNIQIHSVRFDADTKLLRFINNKVKKLLQYSDDIIGAEVFLRLDKAQDTENKITEIKLDIPRNPLFARKQSKTFEEATDNAVDALKKQITKKKEKRRGV